MVVAATNSSGNIAAAVDAVCLVLFVGGVQTFKEEREKQPPKKQAKKTKNKTETKKASYRKKNKMQLGNNLLHMPAGLLVSNLDQ
jgi:hypothetical protein